MKLSSHTKYVVLSWSNDHPDCSYEEVIEHINTINGMKVLDHFDSTDGFDTASGCIIEINYELIDDKLDINYYQLSIWTDNDKIVFHISCQDGTYCNEYSSETEAEQAFKSLNRYLHRDSRSL
jgi:hypothetical protein